MENMQPPKDKVDDRGNARHDTMEDDDCNHLILNQDHFKKGMNNKGKNIVQDKNHDAIINKQLNTVDGLVSLEYQSRKGACEGIMQSI